MEWIVKELTADGLDVATRWYRAPEIMLSFANYVGLHYLELR